MKHKFFVPILAAALTLAILPLAGCTTPTQMRNPYEVATGTGEENVAQWLAGNQTSKSNYRILYEEAQSDGYAGTFPQFLQEIGAATDDTVSVNTALMSVVSIHAGFTREAEGQSSGYSVIGSGVFYSVDREKGNAYVITNYHVLYSSTSNGREKNPHHSDQIALYLYGGETTTGAIEAEYVGGAMEYDIAVLKVENSTVLKESSAQGIRAADSDAVTVGERVYAVGNADARGISAVSGIVSVAAEYINVRAADDLTTISLLEMRTDAPVNHGNSGGGLFNAEGELVGIVNARSEQSGVEHLGYAIPANLALSIAQNIIDNSKTNSSMGALRATLGVTVQVSDSKSYFDEATGKAYVMETVTVKEISRGGACYGKLKVGDVICSIRINDGEQKFVTRMHIFTTEMFKVRRGNTVTILASRGGSDVIATISFQSNNNFTLFS